LEKKEWGQKRRRGGVKLYRQEVAGPGVQVVLIFKSVRMKQSGEERGYRNIRVRHVPQKKPEHSTKRGQIFILNNRRKAKAINVRKTGAVTPETKS